MFRGHERQHLRRNTIQPLGRLLDFVNHHHVVLGSGGDMLALFETLMMGEALKARCNRGLPADLHFWGDNQANTRDLVQAATAFRRRIGEPGHKPWLVYGGIRHGGAGTRGRAEPMTKKALILADTGQDGACLPHLLLAKGYRVVGSSRDAQMSNTSWLERLGIAGEGQDVIANFRSSRLIGVWSKYWRCLEKRSKSGHADALSSDQ